MIEYEKIHLIFWILLIAYDASRDGYNKYRFKNGNLVITHLFDENR